MTDKTDLIREIHEYVTTHGGENTATHLLVQAASAIQTQAAELEAVGAGGVSGPLVGRAAPPTAQAEGWTKLPGQLPEPGMPVLLDIGKKYPIRAMWAAKHTVQAADDDTNWGEYVEEDDMYYAPEGWYEWNQCEDNHWRVTETPRAWMPLPPTSAEGWSMGERSNPNNCASCRHKQNPDGGHCYMFRFEPTEMCAQHTSQIHALQALLEAETAPQPAPDCHHRPPCDECAAMAAQGGKV